MLNADTTEMRNAGTPPPPPPASPGITLGMPLLVPRITTGAAMPGVATAAMFPGAALRPGAPIGLNTPPTAVGLPPALPVVNSVGCGVADPAAAAPLQQAIMRRLMLRQAAAQQQQTLIASQIMMQAVHPASMQPAAFGSHETRPGSQTRSRSRSPQQAVAAGSTVMTIGRHQGLTYAEVARQQPGYCQWALRVHNPYGELRHFVMWLRQMQLAGATFDRDQSEPDSDVGAVTADGGSNLESDPFSSSPEASCSPRTSRGSRQHSVVDALPRVKFDLKLFSGSPHPESCPICMEDWESVQSEIVITPCFHVFHSSCLEGWVKRSCECPSCRWDISNTGEKTAFRTSMSLSSSSAILVEDDD